MLGKNLVRCAHLNGRESECTSFTSQCAPAHHSTTPTKQVVESAVNRYRVSKRKKRMLPATTDDDRVDCDDQCKIQHEHAYYRLCSHQYNVVCAHFFMCELARARQMWSMRIVFGVICFNKTFANNCAAAY